jgi:glycosyltransferase involved in cell wall biosynthesis
LNILIVAPYILLPEYPEFSKNTTGLGIMVETISRAVASDSEMSVQIYTNTISSRKNINGYEIRSHTVKDLILHVKIRYIDDFFHNLIKPSGTKSRLKSAYYALNTSYLEYTIKQWADIVHFHDLGYLSVHGMDICEKLGKKYVLTLHTLTKDSPFGTDETRKWESIYVPRSISNGCAVSVISTEMKEKLLDWYDVDKPDLIKVILNTSDLRTDSVNSENIRVKYSIPTDSKLIICAGLLSKRKNQIQLVRAFKKLSTEAQKHIYILLIGADSDDRVYLENLNNLLADDFIGKHIQKTGYVSHNHISSYYAAADANAVVSVKEPFGLPYVEAMHMGIPTLTFTDIESTKDVCFPETSICVSERNDQSLAEGICAVIRKKWDKDDIKRKAKGFSTDAMGRKYVDCYKELGSNI